jgi:hypothetical protein
MNRMIDVKNHNIRNKFSADRPISFLGLKMFKYSTDHLIANLLCALEGADRVAIISHNKFARIERLCPELWCHRPSSPVGEAADGNVSLFQSEVFGLGKRID